MVKKFLNKLHQTGGAIGWHVVSFFLTPMISNGYCNPKSIYADLTEREKSNYVQNLSGYCEYYDGIYSGFFGSGDNSFYELLTFTLLITFVGFLLEVLFSFFTKDAPNADLSIIEMLQSRFGYFILVLICVWGVGIFL